MNISLKEIQLLKALYTIKGTQKQRNAIIRAERCFKRAYRALETLNN